MKRSKRERHANACEYYRQECARKKHTLGKKKLMHLLARMTESERQQFFARPTPIGNMAESAMNNATVAATDAVNDEPTIKL